MMKILVSIFVSLCLARFAQGLENGLALTPPMGWMSWERFRCETNCKIHPQDCISENLIKEMAYKMAHDGYASAGYEYVIVDDCWLAKTRDSQGRLQPDPERFPSGIKNLSDYVHSLGLKFGIYEDYGNKTCAGYPGIFGHLKEDAELFASWEIDYIKIDGCYIEPENIPQGYMEFGKLLQETNRKIVYSCSWPAYMNEKHIQPNYTEITKTCNLWRDYDDIEDSWESVQNIMQYVASKQEYLNNFIGPGRWNDPDMLIIGNYGLSYGQAKAQMAVWAILAAPLIMSNDLRTIKKEFKDILLNREAIKINQDPLGIPGKLKYSFKRIDVWTRPITPTHNKSNSWAIAIVNRGDYGSFKDFSFPLKRIDLDDTKFYNFTEVYDEYKSFVLSPKENLRVFIPPSSAFLFKVTEVNRAEYSVEQQP